MSPINLNVAGIADWSTEWVFVDLMKASREWITQSMPGLVEQGAWNTGTAITLQNTTGYPALLQYNQVTGAEAIATATSGLLTDLYFYFLERYAYSLLICFVLCFFTLNIPGRCYNDVEGREPEVAFGALRGAVSGKRLVKCGA
jgi:hypothetical protein